MNVSACTFAYREYSAIIYRYKVINCDFPESINRDSFAVIRHDVEFNVERAASLARIDAKAGIVSTFLFQVTSNAYNILSNVNRQRIIGIRDQGLKIGLHLQITDVRENDWEAVEREIVFQANVLEQAIGIEVDRFSFHRPPDWVLNSRENYIAGYLNLYGKSFFEFDPKPKKIKYIADSRHRFDYGHPLDSFNFEKFHLLLHPDEWSVQGFGEYDNFRELENENSVEFERTLQSETPKNFKPNLERGKK